MADVSQLLRKNNQGGYKNIFPKTYLDNIIDKESGMTLSDILSGFNMYFLSYTGSRSQTRLQVPEVLRKNGLWITYVLFDNTVVTEWYNSSSIDDTAWQDNSNWRDGSNSLVGDISISSNGNWVINGIETDIPARGPQGDRLQVRVSEDQTKIEYSYDSINWSKLFPLDLITPTFELDETEVLDADQIPSVTNSGDNFNFKPKFHLPKAKQVSVNSTETIAAGSDANVEDVGDANELKLKFSIPGSTPVNVGTVTTLAAGSEAKVTNGGSAYNVVLNFSIPMGNTGAKGEKGDGWECKGFVDAVDNLPSSGQTVGDLYLVGTTEPYDVYVYKGSSYGWVNIGNALEIKASVIDGGRADSKYGGARTFDCGGADAYLY